MNMKIQKISDEIFSESNFIGTIIWKNKFGAGAKTKGFICVHEYIVCYSKTVIKSYFRIKWNRRKET